MPINTNTRERIGELASEVGLSANSSQLTDWREPKTDDLASRVATRKTENDTKVHAGIGYDTLEEDNVPWVMRFCYGLSIIMSCEPGSFSLDGRGPSPTLTRPVTYERYGSASKMSVR